MNYFNYDDMYDDTRFEQYIEKEMHNKKNSAVEKLSQIVHPAYAENFAKVLANSWLEGDKEACRIADDFHLSEEEFVAIMEDFDQYVEMFQAKEYDRYLSSLE